MQMFKFLLNLLLLVGCSWGLDERIAGGELAKEGQFPYMVALHRYGKFACGGAIIDKHWIVTAAHCIKSYPADSLSFVAGTTDRTEGGTTFYADRAIKHEEWDGDLFLNDIALVKLTEPITFTDQIQPVPLHKEHVSAGTDVVLSGWGRENEDEHSSEYLHYVHLDVITHQECQKKHKHEVTSTMLCTYTKVGQGSCKGDSGSPLVLNGEVVGLSSWGKHCGGSYPNVYTRVEKFIDWVQKTMSEN